MMDPRLFALRGPPRLVKGAESSWADTCQIAEVV